MALTMTKRAFAAALLGLVLLAWGGSAWAQSVAINEGSIQRSAGFRSSSLNPLWISRADCLANDVFNFPLTVSSYQNYQLEVWAGGGSADCRTLEARAGASPQCWKVWQGVPTSTGTNVVIRTQDIVAQNKPNDAVNGPNTGNEDDCTAEDGTVSAPQAVTLYFMFVDATSQEQVGGAAWATKFDLVGPTAPTGVTTGIGDTLLVLEWKQSKDTDLAGYNFYCDPIPGEEGDNTNVVTFAADASLDLNLPDACDPETGTCDDAGADDASADGATSDAAATTDAAADATTSGGSACPTNVLFEGDIPDEKYRCGSGSGTSGRVTGLQNGVRYSVAVAAIDGVGNSGKLSNVTCQSPSPVDDFFKVYRDAGGQGGGGFCSVPGAIGHGAGLSGLALIVAAAVASMLRRRKH